MVAPAAYSGDIFVAGGSTVYPHAEAMVICFRQEGFAGNITIDNSSAYVLLARLL
jgi:hypothetical protein